MPYSWFRGDWLCVAPLKSSGSSSPLGDGLLLGPWQSNLENGCFLSASCRCPDVKWGDKEVTSSGVFLNGADWKSVQHRLGKLSRDDWHFLQQNDSLSKN